LTLIAATGERIAFYDAARQHDKEALRVIASVMMNAKQPTSLRLAAANNLLDRACGRAPVAVSVDQINREMGVRKIVHQVSWLPPDPAECSGGHRAGT